ncbi:hypothetical protein OA416_04235 [Paracoccaceae bacterium]|nr:hypothetical protein [Paracoccaceae bacterium]
MNKSKLALNLSKTSIQLLRKDSNVGWNVLGSADPSSENLEKDLTRLRGQAAALSTKKPIVDVLLPRELVLSQTVVIEDDFSIEYCKRVTAERCGLNENEILIAIGDSSTRSTVPVAAISTNSINESRNFVRKAGFLPEKYIASSKISGFKISPVFFNDNSSKQIFDLESKTLTKVLAFASILLFVGFMASLASVFLEYRSNNIPYGYLASSENFFEKENKSRTKLILLREVKKIPRRQLTISNFKLKDSNFAYVPPKLRSGQPELNLETLRSNIGQLTASVQAIKIEELGLVKAVSPTSNPGKPKQFDDLKEVSDSFNRGVSNLYYNRLKKLPRTLPKMEQDLSFASNATTLLSKKSMSVSNSFEPKKVLAFPTRERIVNHRYKKILIEEVFSDISSTKILINTANKRSSTLPLLYFHSKRPDITNPNELISVSYIKDEGDIFIRPADIKQNVRSLAALKPLYSNNLLLDRQYNLSLKEQGVNIKLLNRSKDSSAPKLGLWNGKQPPLKPKIIDSIKVLEDPTRSTGAVTFVGLPPEIPLAVTKLKKVSALSIKNLNVKNNPPSIPKRSSIVGNSTQKNLIELNRTNLIGVFGKRTGRIALIRLSSGNTVKVRAGQQFGDGWKVISIDLDKIHISNGSRQETLRIPG